MAPIDMDMMTRIREITSRYPEGRPAEIEESLVKELLEVGKDRMDRAEPETVERPNFADPFPGVHSLPEIRGPELDATTLGGAVLYHGALLVRGLYDEAQLARLNRLAEDYRKTKKTKHTLLMNTPAALLGVLEVYQDCGLLDAVKGYVGEPPVLMAQRAKLRQHLVERKPHGGGLSWHQDVAFFGRQSYAINCWAAVSRCGDRSPNLQVIPRRIDRLVGWDAATGIAPVDYGKAISEAEFATLCGVSEVASPVLEPGDAILFDEMTLHRTGRAQAKHDLEDQIVTISWFFRPSGIPGHRTPIAV